MPTKRTPADSDEPITDDTPPVRQRNKPAEPASLSDSANGFIEQGKDLVDDTLETLDIQGRMERHPYQTLLIAAGVGYILGGGLFTAFTARAIRTTLRVAALPMVQKELTAIAQAAINARSDS